MSGSPLSCLFFFCERGRVLFAHELGASLGLQGVSYLVGQTASESAFGFYLA